MSENKPLIEVKGLKEYFNINVGMLRTKPLKAVDDVSFYINKGETLGLVGESGCGKSTLANCILKLITPESGEIWFDGQNILKFNRIKLPIFPISLLMIFYFPKFSFIIWTDSRNEER